MFDYETVCLGLVPPVSLVLAAVSIRLPFPVSHVGIALLILAGPAGGYVAGTMVGGARLSRVVHGLLSGSLGGLLLGSTLTYTIYESAAPRHTVYWWIHHAVATNTPPDIVVAYGYYVLAGIGVASTLWFALGAAVAAAASGNRVVAVEA
ncbi:hypothetical protein [Halostella sp. PRR32]|uniref:hypothetical protein n=1 Tax=Halostella sp. PRR32 TaxID=3098147 RepID=UPI002B1E2349|nr:hypothetical protein [Halostella sp. PRR32]